MIPITFGGMLLLLFLGIPVAVALFGLALGLDWMYAWMPLYRAIGTRAWATSNDILLITIPLFILLGEIMLRSGTTERMYGAMGKWLAWLPGGLMHANIGASLAFAASCGSSVATAATVSTVSIPVIEKFKYNERLFLGSLASGGTLGILVPPSINLIVYGFLTETSVPKLYLAGIVPGILLATLFMGTIIVLCLWRPAWGGVPMTSTWIARVMSLPDLLPPMSIFFVVLGSIYAGWATPTEAASLGLLGAMLVAALNGRLTWQMLRESILGAMRTTGMIVLILVAAWYLNFVMSTIGANRMLNEFLSIQISSPFWTLMAVIGFYVVLGTVMEPMPMMIITVPTITPLMVSLGYDPVWFGILIVILCESALISPPVGATLFVVQGIRNRGSMNDVFMGVIPFNLTLILMIVVITAFPQIALWLPRTLG